MTVGGDQKGGWSKRWRGLLRPVVAAAAVVIALTAVTVAAVYVAGTESTAQVAADATVYGRAESLLSAATATQSRLSEAMTALAANDPGQLDEERLSAAEDALAETVARADSLIAELDRTELASVDEFIGVAGQVVTTVGQGRIPTDAAISGLDRAYESLVEDVVAVRRQAAQSVRAARSQAGTLTAAARSFVVIVVPLLAVYMVHRALRSRQRHLELQTRLDAETKFRHDKDELIASVGHELRTPLTGVLGLAETLRQGRRTFNSGERNRMIETIADESRELASRVDDLVVVGRADADLLTTTNERVDVRAVIRKVTYGWEARTRTRLTVIGRGIAMADPHHVEHVLRNLLNNAVRHGGDEIEVRIHRGSLVLAIEVRDSGNPASTDNLPSPQENGSPRPGLGLGLAAAHRLTERMGGSLEHRGTADATVFTLKLPMALGLLGTSGREIEEDLVLDPRRLRPTRKDIEEAIDDVPPSVVYEPIVSLVPSDEPSIVGYEALARFRFGGPPTWFREASALGMGVELELRAIRQAVAGFYPSNHEFLSVNVSDDSLVSYGLRDALQGIPPERVVLELSEDAAIASYEATGQAVQSLQNDGYRLALDDVGQGETDLWHVLRMKPSIVKLDVSIVRDLAHVSNLRAMVAGIVALGTSLDCQIIAEGIEDAETAVLLQELGVHLGQGHFYGQGIRFVPDDKAVVVRSWAPVSRLGGGNSAPTEDEANDPGPSTPNLRVIRPNHDAYNG